CNKDFTCVEGFCPSFVSVEGARLHKPPAPAARHEDFPELPEPAIARPEGLASILVTGIGGTGVVTIGQVLGMAAHVDGLCCSVLDVTGLAQKYGAVLSHVRIAPRQEALHATRIAAGEADTVVGCDLIVTAGDEAVGKMRPGTRVAVCTDLIPTAEFARNRDWQVDAAALMAKIAGAAGDAFPVEGIRIASALLGDAIAANMFMLGVAWQRGWIPLSRAAIERAIELNGVQPDFNKRCFLWGRRAAHDLPAVEARARAALPAAARPAEAPDETLAQAVERRAAILADYQDEALAGRYRARVGQVAAACAAGGYGERLPRAVAEGLFRLLAVKDEWEVARLFASPEFERELDATFRPGYRLRFHLGAWPFGSTDPVTGHPVKGEVGGWAMGAFRLMARLRRLRGSWLDPFRHNDERKLADRLLADYEADLDAILARLSAASLEAALKLAALPDKVRGFGHVKAAAAETAAKEREELRYALQNPPARQAA
ncbi:MAG: 2-oxoacid:acceptor oxidoreductase family protein, partial [Rhodocyclaceae bacterium]|nr:2-oxoacid:acceptor oxidoreductase family protein [Rhodocyclaceae bacterium]